MGVIRMSRYCRKHVSHVAMPETSNNCICSLPTLVILILIVLQFSRKKDRDYDEDCDDEDYEGGYSFKQVDNSILFIIALFFLSCAGCGKGGHGY